ncbi:uncharacterized protein LOC129576799 [Sitodiplosis mosellana]|uniref:uncharacterized protein LOC129576799 n=1 Tax=Sitodiplosis mosellana TaxID=263140 RepID=UPI002443C5AD|nr:uncharacterized protein LOC129576799 [Sitodiplosis mosellana]
MNNLRLLPFVICLLFVSPVHLYPRPNNAADQLAANKPSAQLETLNSTIVSVNVKNEIEKPVFRSTDATNVKSVKTVTDVPKSESSPSSEQARQYTIPFMAVPANWFATFQPQNAIVIAQKVPLRIWAIGSVSRFPTFLENFVQRIQSYYSTYKYHDLSRPAPLAIINPTYHLHDTSGPAQTDPIDHDPVEEEDITDASTTDFYDTTTDLTYDYDDNKNTESTENGDFITV